MNAYTLAKERYAALGVDTEAVLETLKNVTVSVHCWQGDDVVGFDAKEALSGGIQTTGNYPGKATTPEQLMADFDEVLRLTPGKKKLNLHASYAIFEAGEFADRDAIQPKHFSRWVAYAKERGLGIDFNPTFFSHSMVKDGLTLSSPDETVRHFWVEHGKRCMAIAEYFAEETGKPSDKISSMLLFNDRLALHITRPMRWDSDHVVLFDDETREMMKEIVRADALGRVFLATDYFDASINRISAWVTGLHSVQKALLYALLEPKTLKALQDANNFTELMVRQEELKTMPFGAVWEEYLRRENIPQDYFAEIKRYEADVLSKR